MGRSRATALALGMTFALLAPLPASSGVPVLDEEQDCLQIPHDEQPALPPDPSKKLRLSVRVMSDPADLPAVRTLMRTTVEAYARIGIAMRLSFDSLPVPASLGGKGQEAFLDFMKKRYGGRRPKGVDVVYLATRHWSGGFADCIGGVRFPDRAFAYGSVDYAVEGVVPAPFVGEGLIAAHEIGHLLGAHHHHSNCAEANPSAAQRGEVGGCTVMTPVGYTITGTFATLETAFVRHYTARYANG